MTAALARPGHGHPTNTHEHGHIQLKAPPIPQSPKLASRGSNPCTGGGRAHHGHGDGAPQALRQRAPPPAALPHHAALLLGTPPPASWFIFVARRHGGPLFLSSTYPLGRRKDSWGGANSFSLIWFGLFACAGVPAGDGGEIRCYRTF
jgi:hypothetical protein